MQLPLALLLNMSARAICSPTFGDDMPRMGKPPVDLGSSEEERDSAKCVIPVGWASSPSHVIDGLEARPTKTHGRRKLKLGDENELFLGLVFTTK